jgi:tight adherence protein C
LIIGIACVAVAIVIVVYMLVGGTTAKSNETAMVVLAPDSTSVVPIPRSGVDPADPIPPIYRRFAAVAGKLTPASYGRTLQRKLDVAGNPRGWVADRVLALKGIGLVAGILVGVLVGIKHGSAVFFFPIIGGVLFFYMPDIWIRNLGEHRQQDLRLGLPDAIDMMIVCVEAGLGFDAALGRVARDLKGPMASECARVLQEMQFGMSRTEALRALVNRTDLPELRTFVSSLVQSTELGISIGDVLREQAKEMRIKRRQRAEEQAQKLPVRILFPLLLCMLPAMFVVVMGPAAINILHTLSGLTHH